MAKYKNTMRLSIEETRKVCDCLGGFTVNSGDDGLLFCSRNLTFENGYTMRFCIGNSLGEELPPYAELYDNNGTYLSYEIGDDFFGEYTIKHKGNTYTGIAEGDQRIIKS